MPYGISSFFDGIPSDLLGDQSKDRPQHVADTEEEAKARQYVIAWRNQLRQLRWQKQQIWNECWQLYRGLEDWTDKEDWNAKIVLPKSFNTVKTATNVIKRLMSTARQPWNIEAVNSDDLVAVLRAEQMTDLVKLFTEKAYFLQEFSEALECSFILGFGAWKVWWGLVPRTITSVENNYVSDTSDGSGLGPNAASGQVTSEVAEQGNPQARVPYGNPPQQLQSGDKAAEQPPSAAYDNPYHPSQGVPTEPPPPKNILGQVPKQLVRTFAALYPNQLPFEEIAPMGLPGQPQQPSFQPRLRMEKQIVRKEVLEGKLFIKAVDPYNFYWLPGSKLNRWLGTIEDIEVPKYELIQMGESGIFPLEKIAAIKPQKIDEQQKMSALRWSETVRAYNGPNTDTGVVKLTEYYGPIVYDGKIVKKHAHMLIANDSITLFYRDNGFWHKKAPYIGFSPLSLPFRTEGVGLIEMVRQIDKSLNKLANMSVDTLFFRLLPMFEVTPDAFENPEDFETAITPGKIFRRNITHTGLPGITPVQTEDISQGAIQVAAMLDRAHHEGSLVSDIAESLPRYRGNQTATETQALQQNMDSFMGNMAVDIEKLALEPLIEMCMDLVLQFLDTSNDPRVASILGVGADVIQGMSRAELMELVQGEYKVKVSGISGQLWKAEILQQLVQLMNLIGQNPQAWLPYINEDALLRRILDSFRPMIHDIEQIIADPETAQAKKLAMQKESNMGDLVRIIPQLAQMAHQSNMDHASAELDLQKQTDAQANTQRDQALQAKELQMQQQQMMMDQQAQAAQSGGNPALAAQQTQAIPPSGVSEQSAPGPVAVPS
jgi:hypothetical protein